MGKGTARDPEKEATWRRRLEQHADSGQSIRAWCREHGMTETAFYWWRRELARRDTKEQATSFVPVHVTGDLSASGEPQIEVVLSGGRRVRVMGPVDRQMLTDVLDVLERRAC